MIITLFVVHDLTNQAIHSHVGRKSRGGTCQSILISFSSFICFYKNIFYKKLVDPELFNYFLGISHMLPICMIRLRVSSFPIFVRSCVCVCHWRLQQMVDALILTVLSQDGARGSSPSASRLETCFRTLLDNLFFISFFFQNKSF